MVVLWDFHETDAVDNIVSLHEGVWPWFQALVSVHSNSGLHLRLTGNSDGGEVGDGEAEILLLQIDTHVVRDLSSWRARTFLGHVTFPSGNASVSPRAGNETERRGDQQGDVGGFSKSL